MTDIAKIGKKGERIAARYLRRNGYRVVARNVHCGRNELDLIVKNRTDLVFVEVKTRTFETSEAALSRPALAVNVEKRRRTVEATREYLRAHPTKLCPRIDVVEVYLDRSRRLRPFRVEHVEAAVTARGGVR